MRGRERVKERERERESEGERVWVHPRLVHASTLRSLPLLCQSDSDSLGALTWILLTEKQMKCRIRAALRQFQGNFAVIAICVRCCSWH